MNTKDNIRLIKSREEFDAFYYYEKKASKAERPIYYPCIVEKIHEECGITGPYVTHKITYIPESFDILSFAAGYMAGVASDL